MSNKRKYFGVLVRFSAVAGVIACCAPAQGQSLFLDVGHLELQPNLPGQQLQFFVNNTSDSPIEVKYADLFAWVGDSTAGPLMTSADLVTGTPFSLVNNTGTDAGDNTPWAGYWYTEALNPQATIQPGQNLFGTITFDTTGLFASQWFLGFDAQGTTRYADIFGDDISINITNGSLTVVPEPAEYAALAALGCLAWAAYNRRAKLQPTV